ncbi:hypothetical protein CGLO_07011 [Colletotrichum gloeosporioides Cg-14]|uniref:Heterokaryon incompatibility domain-containing protein n=1 Tax=Colletotrichum gloeosporioides (strain Cg-14) TaxID=1237896 RepID=T0LNK0_COLGC|nr:hypothetical protein CGLO_07011 [Colletotrichum gloeosporioides Cg-14]
MELPNCLNEIAIELGAKPGRARGNKRLLSTFASLADADAGGPFTSIYSEWEAEMEARAPKFSLARKSTIAVPLKAYSADVPRFFDKETQRRLKTNAMGDMPLRLINTTTGKVEIGQGTGRYAALSYVWKQMSDLDTVLEPILNLVREAGIHWLWVDQRCILQEDDQDKDTEVPKMGKYYGGAAVTVALVPEIRELDKLSTVQMGEYAEEEGVRTWPDWKEQLAFAWWTSRVWTFQEAALSENLAVIAQGASSNMDTIIWASNVRDMRQDGQKILFSGRQGTKDVCTGSGFFGWKYYHHSGYGWPRAVGSQGKMELGDIWDMTVGRDCFKSLDRIYGLLGCLAGASSVTVDYDMDEPTLMCQLAKAGMLRSEVMVDVNGIERSVTGTFQTIQFDGIQELSDILSYRKLAKFTEFAKSTLGKTSSMFINYPGSS